MRAAQQEHVTQGGSQDVEEGTSNQGGAGVSSAATGTSPVAAGSGISPAAHGEAAQSAGSGGTHGVSWALHTGPWVFGVDSVASPVPSYCKLV